MRVLNPSRFNVEVGTELSYNIKAIEWMNQDLLSRGKDPWPTAEELSARNPKVVKADYQKDASSRKTYIELWVEHDDGYTGLSGVIDKQYTADVWFLNSDGTFLDECSHPLFTKRKK